jgi:hypothetical protein
MKTTQNTEIQSRPVSRNVRRLANVELPVLEYDDDFLQIEPLTNRFVGRLQTGVVDEDGSTPSWRSLGARWTPTSRSLRSMGEE